MQSIPLKTYAALFAALFVVYAMGLFVPLMDQDPGHHATIALHMYLSGDYVNLIDRGTDYLDKPHLHFWLSALSYSIFGVNTFAYKFPSLLVTVLGVYATFGIGRRLYSLQTGRIAALIFASAQAQILALNDVRMDALLTSFIAAAIWQLIDFVYTKRGFNLVFGALFTAAAFCTKGMIGLAMPGVAVFFLLIYQRNWPMFLTWRWLVFALLFAVFISPVVYCYYLQFDLHPEKIIRGTSGHSGVKFILWNQNTERLDGSKWGGGKKDYFFFFHTLLWAFLPWCLLTYDAYFRRAADLVRTRFRYLRHHELVLPGLITVIFTLISSSGFQLPHYLNILFPSFSVLIAGVLDEKTQVKTAYMARAAGVQYFVVTVCVLLIIVLNVWSFPLTDVWVIALAALILGALAAVFTRKNLLLLEKILIVSVLSSVFVNVLMNGNFYPKLVRYQAGLTLAENEQVKQLNQADIYFYNAHSYCFDFYHRYLHADADIHVLRNTLQKKPSVWVYTSPEMIAELTGAGLQVAQSVLASDYRITRLTPKFLNPKTRAQTLGSMVLVELKKDPDYAGDQQ